MAVDYRTDSSQDAINAKELELYNLIMDYRATLGLASVPLSEALSTVAARHALDTVENVGTYSGHSWSDAPYDPSNPATYGTIWYAPQRLQTDYPGNGYEISTGYTGNIASYEMSPERALQNWQGSPPHNDVLTNQGPWDDPWLAIGIGMYKGIAHVWFGHETDPDTGPSGVITGTPGLDIYTLDAGRGAATIETSDKTIIITTGTISVTLSDYERVAFNDGVLAFDISGTAGQGYRIYQAAFDRTPDAEGLSFWIGEMDGGMSLYDVSTRFLISQEFIALYGASPSNAEFVDLLYRNVLGREGEAEGTQWWNEQLDSGAYDRARTLASFSESDENVANVAGAIADGIWLT
ncbi:hypothetical protein GCM10007989_04590 [Devosia pacifica]|uniref:DUF4214 domain-containing protein n=1 Tax=Devosia pacifica TaxID=1335967 RepID=A0A918RVL6_9HYPH|nr:DUF4214 domain-containing protein [Devosia pacifica]GHA13103.1 hypothetical protein GCM10007989_04590 [Devosia pacifica]